jgi:hypothetical protein
MGLLVLPRLFHRRQLGFGQQDAVLGGFGFQSLEAFLHVFEVMALPDTAHPEGRDGQAALAQFVSNPCLAPGWLLNGDIDHRLFNLRLDAVLQDRLATADLHQRQLATGLIKVLEAVEAFA